jgi:hypothetical protein
MGKLADVRLIRRDGDLLMVEFFFVSVSLFPAACCFREKTRERLLGQTRVSKIVFR